MIGCGAATFPPLSLSLRCVGVQVWRREEDEKKKKGKVKGKKRGRAELREEVNEGNWKEER